ncbi:sugar transferase [Pseudoxanthomonas suwonensis]|uniref:sugar transferase n=1 Tax=Pseudoxanthomonas suwonensis TaxID=314722 RepID=UPI000465BACC|nr:sugar transferase [Pseudoxanthomonas suwonensis]
MQRLFDIILSFIALAILSPLLVPVAVVLRMTGEGEVFYVQQRVGRGGRSFGLFKFATMLKNSPNLGTGTVTVKDDPRVLPVGRFLRRTKINELPQLINILKGDMSIIGPRPQTHRCFDAFPAEAQAEIIKVRPGLSGVGSIVFRDEEVLMHVSSEPERFYDTVIMPYKGELERWYVAHQGMGTYLLLIGLTAWVVLVPGSTAVWRFLDELPLPPAELVKAGGAKGAPATGLSVCSRTGRTERGPAEAE